MLPQDAFLRAMPRAIDLESRLRFEAIVTSVDIIDLAYRRLTDVLTRLARCSDVLAVISDARVDVTTHCWTIIDHLHNLRELTKKSQEYDEWVATFTASIEPATLMRNAMDHLSGRLGNFSQTKGSALPMHGCISFAASTEDGFEWIQLALGAPHHTQQHSAAIDMWMVAPTNTVDHINFAAFNDQLDFSRVVTELRELITGLNEAFETHVHEQAQQTATKNNIDVNKLLADRVTGTFFFRIRTRSSEPGTIKPDQASLEPRVDNGGIPG